MLFKTYVIKTKRKQTYVGTTNAIAKWAAPVFTSINLDFHILNIHMHDLIKDSRLCAICQLFCYCFG